MKTNTSFRMIGMIALMLLMAQLMVFGQALSATDTSIEMSLYGATNLPPMPPGMLDWIETETTTQSTGMGMRAMDALGLPGIGSGGSPQPMGGPMQPSGYGQPVYTYAPIDLGTLGGYYSFARGINAGGQVVGWSYVSGNDNFHAFLYSNNVMKDLGTMGDSQSYAYGINTKGQVVGWTGPNNSSSARAFIYSGGVMQDLTSLIISNPGWVLFQATAINNLGQIVGWGSNPSGYYDAFLFSNGTVQDLGTLGGSGSEAFGINDYGQVTGFSYTSDDDSHAFLYNNGPLQDLGTINNAGGSDGEAINASGQVAGLSTFSGSIDHAFLYTGGVMEDLGALDSSTSAGYGLNDLGQVVGGDNDVAILYSNGQMTNLNKLLFNTSSGWTLLQANGINNAGQIVGYGDNPSGYPHAFLLNPVPPGAHETIEAQPTQKVYGVPPVKQPGKDNLIVVTHGWVNREQSLTFAPYQSWLDDVENCIYGYVNKPETENWQVCAYHWEQNAWAWNPGAALASATQEGISLGNAIANEGWTHVHFIAHSAGSQVIEIATGIIKEYSPSTTVQCTFLDPYVGYNLQGTYNYGLNADWSDRYAASGDIENAVKPFTTEPLDYAYNVDVTELDPEVASLGIFVDVNGPTCFTRSSSHQWPITFYTNTVAGNITSSYGNFGFPYSKEGGLWDYATNAYPVGNGVNYGSVTYLGNPPSGCSGLGANQPISVTQVIFSSLGMAWQSVTGTIEINGGGLTHHSGSPAWVGFISPYTNAVNVIDFDANFTSRAGAAGLYTVYWDSNVVGSIDESVVGQGTQHYTLPLPLATSFTTHVLGFRLDPFNSIQSIITITNVVLSQVGVSQSFSLTATNTNGSLIYQLSGQSGFDYGLQASSDLINWSQIAVLENTNGTVDFYDTNSAGYPVCRFYRAVAPY